MRANNDVGSGSTSSEPLRFTLDELPVATSTTTFSSLITRLDKFKLATLYLKLSFSSSTSGTGIAGKCRNRKARAASFTRLMNTSLACTSVARCSASFTADSASKVCMVSNTPETASSSAAILAKYNTRSSLFKVFRASKAEAPILPSWPTPSTTKSPSNALRTASATSPLSLMFSRAFRRTGAASPKSSVVSAQLRAYRAARFVRSSESDRVVLVSNPSKQSDAMATSNSPRLASSLDETRAASAALVTPSSRARTATSGGSFEKPT